ncbi:MAG: molybdopterin converting factor subunit 1 [Chloroflexi bacterium]|nr:molybdopterin converting factor subunit 1 [Chloroflexota bacterium]MCY4246681.1 molybdopterin converting factor subunit 1 [Chloroflexota bacterium]
MQIKVLFFATLRDRIGARQLEVALDEGAQSIGGLRSELMRRHPAASQNLQVALAAINEEFAFDSDAIQDGDEVAFFPPVSGGAAGAFPEIFRLPTGPIDHNEIIAAITTPRCGAVCLFTGIVRGATDKPGHLAQTEWLEYEAYQAMALTKMKQVAAEIRARWRKVEGIAIIQRLGVLQVGENTVLCACSAPHRDDGCFEAARYGIDRLKEIVPVWKKEVGADGASWIEGAYLPAASDKSVTAP